MCYCNGKYCMQNISKVGEIKENDVGNLYV